MGNVKIRNVNPLGYVDFPLLGREGPAPYFAPCPDCVERYGTDHEHTDVITPEGAETAGTGCLTPGEVVEVPRDVAAALVAQVGNFELVEATAKAAKSTASKE